MKVSNLHKFSENQSFLVGENPKMNTMKPNYYYFWMMRYDLI